MELFNLNFPRCAEAPLSLGPTARPCPCHKAITQTQSHTGRASERRGCSCAHRNAGKWENIAPGRHNKSYNELPFQKQFNPCPAEIENAYVEDPQLKHNLHQCFSMFQIAIIYFL